jgi:hypothetical protein
MGATASSMFSKEMIGPALSGAGTGFSAMASMRAGKAQKKLADYNAQVAEYQAADALARGRQAETRLRTDVKGVIGEQRAAFAASGVDINDIDSTAVNVQANTAALGEMDALAIRLNAAREAWGFKSQAADYRYTGKLAKMQGTSAAIGTILTGGAQLAYAKYGFGAGTPGKVR